MDGTDGDSVTIRRMGLLTELSERQSEVLGLIESSRFTQDKTMEDGLMANLGYNDDVIVALVLAMKENTIESDQEITNFDLILAGSLLDHLDTLGYELVRKE